jgi:thioredoxin 1
MATIKITDENFEEQVLKSEKNWVVQFSASWCGPCRIMTPIMEDLSNTMGDKINFGKADIDEEAINISSRHGIRGVPSFLFFSSGKLKSTKVGAVEKSQMQKWLTEQSS